eukprot:TRINITY_DN19530_c0_g1_i5.p1 TRINITY_DN19530_c0_g1~~TRINITY_DN19530_c0_g1_i5.p1  ORF type:complete len:461 (-),score=68.10 TRINITY_DN19530_c0_g1_i5:139-1521(-)
MWSTSERLKSKEQLHQIANSLMRGLGVKLSMCIPMDILRKPEASEYAAASALQVPVDGVIVEQYYQSKKTEDTPPPHWQSTRRSPLHSVLTVSGDEANPGWISFLYMAEKNIDCIFHRDIPHKLSNKERLAYQRVPEHLHNRLHMLAIMKFDKGPWGSRQNRSALTQAARSYFASDTDHTDRLFQQYAYDLAKDMAVPLEVAACNPAELFSTFKSVFQSVADAKSKDPRNARQQHHVSACAVAAGQLSDLKKECGQHVFDIVMATLLERHRRDLMHSAKLIFDPGAPRTARHRAPAPTCFRPPGCNIEIDLNEKVPGASPCVVGYTRRGLPTLDGRRTNSFSRSFDPKQLDDSVEKTGRRAGISKRRAEAQVLAFLMKWWLVHGRHCPALLLEWEAKYPDQDPARPAIDPFTGSLIETAEDAADAAIPPEVGDIAVYDQEAKTAADGKAKGRGTKRRRDS